MLILFIIAVCVFGGWILQLATTPLTPEQHARVNQYMRKYGNQPTPTPTYQPPKEVDYVQELARRELTKPTTFKRN